MQQVKHLLKIAIFFLCLLPVLISGSGCKPEEPYVITCSDGLIAWERLPPTGGFSLQNVGDASGSVPKNLKLIIQYQLDYERYVRPVEYLANIDFERKTLIIVRTNSRLIFKEAPKLSINCKEKAIRWTQNASIPVNLNVELSETNLFVVLIPKVEDRTRLIYEENIVK